MTNDTPIQEKQKSPPTHNICRKYWNGKRTEFETLGVAWARDDGGLYIKLHGKQIIDSGFYAFPIKDNTSGAGQ